MKICAFLVLCVIRYSSASCPPLRENGPGQIIECDHNNARIPCNEGSVPEGTVASFKCDKHYAGGNGDVSNRRQCLPDGSWSTGQQLFCYLDCGKKETSSFPQIIEDQPTSRGNWPWHAAIYMTKSGDWIYTCGGSLVHDRFIVTAGHCLSRKGETVPYQESSLKVILGKYSSAYDIRDEHQQEFDVKQIIIHESYSATPLENDIAILVLDRPAKITLDVRPICLPRKWQIARHHLTPGSLGSIPGWGLTDNGTIAEELRVENLPFVSLYECVQRLPDHLQDGIGEEVICASLFNGTRTCTADNGGGLVFPYGVALDRRWYLEGIVSWGINIKEPDEKPKPCDPIVTFFTSTYYFRKWIENTVFQILGDETEVSTSAPATCPPIIDNGPGLEIQCFHNDIKIPCMEDVPEGTVATFKCSEYYTGGDGDVSHTSRRCLSGGSWSAGLSLNCSLDCGRREESAIIEGQPTSSWPWNAAIYAGTSEDWSYRCGGSLVKDRFIITEGACTHREAGKSLKVILGKHNSSSDVKDKHQQEFDVKQIIKYESEKSTYGNIAILVLDRPVQMTLDVRPVCLPKTSWESALSHLAPGSNVSVSGWGTIEAGPFYYKLRLASILPAHWVLNPNDCVRRVPDDLETYKCSYNSTGMCPASRGSGLVFPSGEFLDRRWYLQGIFGAGYSVTKPGEEHKSCSGLMTYFTDPYYSRNWISAMIKGYRG